MTDNSKIVLCSKSVLSKWQSNDCAFDEKTISVELELQNGKHTFVSEPVELGMYSIGKPICAEISVCYEYMEEDNAIILCGSSYSGKNNNSVTLKEYETDNMLEPVKELLNEISENLIAHAEKQGLLTYVRKDWTVDDPKAEKEFENFKVVYKNGTFYESYDSEKDYDEDCSVYPVSSVYGGTVNIPAGQKFYNIIGSTGDTPKGGGYGSWIGFWETCVQRQNAGCESYSGGWCSGDIIGGHIVFNRRNQNLQQGVNGIAAILPICKRHNANPQIEMTTVRPTTAVWLDQYHM